MLSSCWFPCSQKSHPQMVMVGSIVGRFSGYLLQFRHGRAIQPFLVLNPCQSVRNSRVVWKPRLGLLRQTQRHIKAAAVFAIQPRKIVEGRCVVLITPKNFIVGPLGFCDIGGLLIETPE